MDSVEFDRLVLEHIDPIVAQVKPGLLHLPTPCPAWDLGGLLRHMIGQHRGFAAAARLEPADAAVWEQVALDAENPYATYREAASWVVRDFAREGLADHSIEIFGYGVIPAPITMRMHAVDYLAHGWDVAKTLGVDSTLDSELCEEGLRIAKRWPESSYGSGDPFGAHVEVPDSATASDRLMAFLGRDPAWSA